MASRWTTFPSDNHAVRFGVLSPGLVSLREVLYVCLWDVAHTGTMEQERWQLDRMPSPPGGAAEMPRNIFRYLLATSGWHQLVLVLLTVAVFLLEVVPLELQRRIVNDLVKHREFWLIVSLAAVYAGTVLVQGGTKLALNVYRSWVGERAIRDLRRRVHVLVSSTSAVSSTSEAEGIQASMIVAEVESIGSFVGASISEPLLQGGILFSVLAYMIHVDFWMAGTAFALFVPQLVFVPLMQGAMNRRTRARVQIIRQLSVSVVEEISGNDAQDQADDERIQHVFELNMGILPLQVLDELPDEPEHSAPDYQRTACRRMGGVRATTGNRRGRGLYLGDRPDHRSLGRSRQLLPRRQHHPGQIPPAP